MEEDKNSIIESIIQVLANEKYITLEEAWRMQKLLNEEGIVHG